MNKIVHYIGLDVHKDSIAVSIAPQNSTEIRRYGIIGGTLDAIDNLIKKLSKPELELRFVYEAGPCGFVICRHLRSKGIHCDLVCPSLIPKKARLTFCEPYQRPKLSDPAHGTQRWQSRRSRRVRCSAWLD